VNKRIFLGSILSLVFILILFNSFIYKLNETEQVIITQFGKPVGKAIKTPGLHMKIPFIHDVNRFEKRFLEWDGDSKEIQTVGKRFIKVDTYARWKISNPLLFFQRVKNENGAHSRLDDILEGETRDVIAKHTLEELIRSSRGKLDAASVKSDSDYGRSQIAKKILDSAKKRTAELGIDLLDLRFKRLNYVKKVQASIFSRMISERKQIAEKFRSEGKGKASSIIGLKGKELKSISFLHFA